MKKMLSFILVVGFIIFACNIDSSPPKDSKGSNDDVTVDLDYLEELYQATFNGLIYFVNPDTGFPYDIWNDPGKIETSISNIGLYVASVAVASETGLISEASAIQKISLTLSSLESIEKWRGFPISWIRVDNPTVQVFGTQFSYADHVGNLVCSLMVVRSIFAGVFDTTIDNFTAPMDFDDTYEPSNSWLKGGFDLALNGGLGDYAVTQPWGSWYYNLLAADTRHFSLLGIARGEISDDHFEALNRNNNYGCALNNEIITTIFPGKSNCPYYYPGMLGGGLFMQYLPGIFLSEQDYPTGISAKNFAYCQIEYSKKKGQYPIWGMSSCENPSGTYIGWNSLDLNVITPHASVLAICDYPLDVYKNLKALDAKGVRPMYDDGGGNEYDFGFTDSYDTSTKQASSRYLILDQAMLFLSLANYLHDNVVRENFALDTTGDKVNTVIEELAFTPLNIEDWK